MIAIAKPIKEEYKPVQNTSDIPIYYLKRYYMYQISPAYFADIRTILYNRMPHLSDTDIEILVDIFMSTH